MLVIQCMAVVVIVSLASETDNDQVFNNRRHSKLHSINVFVVTIDGKLFTVPKLNKKILGIMKLLSVDVLFQQKYRQKNMSSNLTSLTSIDLNFCSESKKY